MCVYRECVDGRDEQDNLDALHDAWIELYPKYGPNLQSGALRNRAKQRMCDSFRHSNRNQSLQGNAIEGNAEKRPENQFLEKERARIVQECIRTLSPRYAEILQLTFWEGQTPAEIANDVGRSVTTVYRWLSGAKESLATQARLREFVLEGIR